MRPHNCSTGTSDSQVSQPSNQGRFRPEPPVARLLSIDDIAQILAAGRRTVERLRASGKLPPPDLHVGKMPRWKAETVSRWIDGEPVPGRKRGA